MRFGGLVKAKKPIQDRILSTHYGPLKAITPIQARVRAASNIEHFITQRNVINPNILALPIHRAVPYIGNEQYNPLTASKHNTYAKRPLSSVTNNAAGSFR